MILLDTHVVIWLATSPERISRAAAKAIEDCGASGERPAVSSASVFEIAHGARRGRIQIHVPAAEFLKRLRATFDLLPISEEIAVEAASFPEAFHGDPFDRIITSTALLGGYTLLTNDHRIRSSGLCPMIW